MRVIGYSHKSIHVQYTQTEAIRLRHLMTPPEVKIHEIKIYDPSSFLNVVDSSVDSCDSS